MEFIGILNYNAFNMIGIDFVTNLVGNSVGTSRNYIDTLDK